jgi:hypothetical protein
MLIGDLVRQSAPRISDRVSSRRKSVVHQKFRTSSTVVLWLLLSISRNVFRTSSLAAPSVPVALIKELDDDPSGLHPTNSSNRPAIDHLRSVIDEFWITSPAVSMD